MGDEILNQIGQLIENKMGRYKKPFTRDTALEKDLGISGDDAVDFLLDFSKKFNIDMSKFDIRKYFFPEGDFMLPIILRLITGKKREKISELKLGDLEKAIIAGRLDEEIINS